ncbi:MAG: DUF7501 family protein [Thermoplasmatota archaeon]
MSFECPYCHAALDDEGEAFIAHLRVSSDCRVPWEHEMDTNAAEWERR